MKTTLFRLRSVTNLVIISLLVVLLGKANAQNNVGTENTGKKKYTIHVVKEVNGVTTKIDTTFQSNNEFDIQAFIDKQEDMKDMEKKLDQMQKEMKQLQKEIMISIPEFSDEVLELRPDTIIVNGDTVIVNTSVEESMKEIEEPNNPGMEYYFDKHFEIPDPADLDDLPQAFYFGECPGRGKYKPFNEFNFPGLENILPLGPPDQITIIKKRNGKKIIIDFNDSDNVAMKRKGNLHSSHHDCKRNCRHDPAHGTKIERFKDKDGKDVIIIRKKKSIQE